MRLGQHSFGTTGRIGNDSSRFYDTKQYRGRQVGKPTGYIENSIDRSVLNKIFCRSSEKMQEIPDWESQFGSFKLCDCQHCESVLSPSAYLVDLLAFLRNRTLEKHISGPYNDVKSALGVLSVRRRDIEHINLSCKNTNTPLPYVDLVNEILENAVSYNLGYYQTTGTADELSANPEYLNVGVSTSWADSATA